MQLYLQFFLVAWCAVFASAQDEEEFIPVTYGSVIKLKNKETGLLLHSHPIGWGSGSGQQSVTAHGSQNDQGDLWSIQGASTEDFKEAGSPVACNSKVRLTHVGTNKNLHSHLFKAPLSGNQEISCFGESGEGDTGDDWFVECGFVSKKTNSKHWLRDAPVTFRHVDTKKYLYTSSAVAFTQQNCGMQCPIMGQTEVSAAMRKEGGKTTWTTAQGVFFPPKVTEEEEEDIDTGARDL